MSIQPGDPIPAVTLMTTDGKKLSTADLCRGKKVVLFAVPGAFSPTCSDLHLPGYVMRAEEILAKGVDAIACVAVNDHHVMGAWGKARGTGDQVQMLADGNGDFARAMGLDVDLSPFGMGLRSRRYAAIVDDGIVKALHVEQPGKLEVSTADAILKLL
jgi:glutaredoxin/glutathione-dependent peroxiredoxin